MTVIHTETHERYKIRVHDREGEFYYWSITLPNGTHGAHGFQQTAAWAREKARERLEALLRPYHMAYLSVTKAL